MSLKAAAQSDKNSVQTIDGETGKPEGTPRRIDLSNLRDVRLELAHVYREMDGGRLESQDGTRRAYVLRQIHDVIISTELERRIGELEQRHDLTNGGRPLIEDSKRTH